jgi:hypothetical protein
MIRFILVGSLLAACGNKGDHEGLPPATDWAADPGLGSAAQPAPDPAAEQATPEEPQVEEGIDISSDQPIDPAHRVRGVLKLAKAVADRVKPDGIIYLMAKQPDAAGKPTGTAIAVDRLNWKGDGQSFELGGATGDVLVIARYDQDEDGITTEPGDVVGMARVKVPADNVVIELSTIVP